jgi:prefoldin subunit 5
MDDETLNKIDALEQRVQTLEQQITFLHTKMKELIEVHNKCQTTYPPS